MMKDPLFDPRTCTFKLSAKIRDHVEQLIKDKNVEKRTKSILIDLMDQEQSNKNTLDYESLVKLHKYIQWADPDNSEPFYLFSESCKCINPKQRENKHLNERLKKLRLMDSQAMYEQMVSAIDKSVERNIERRFGNIKSEDGEQSADNSTVTEFKDLYGSVIAVFNSFLVIICTFVFCYKALEYSIPEPNVTYQASFGLFGSLIVAIAELYFLLRVV